MRKGPQRAGNAFLQSWRPLYDLALRPEVKPRQCTVKLHSRYIMLLPMGMDQVGTLCLGS